MQPTTKRQRFTAEQAREHVLAQQHSKLSIQQYCQANEINPSSFYNWRVKYKSPTNSPSKKPHKPNKPEPNYWLAVPGPKTETSIGRTTSDRPDQANEHALVKLTLPGGMVLEIRAN